MQTLEFCPECGSHALIAERNSALNKLFTCEACGSLLKAERESTVFDVFIAGLLLIVSILFLSIAVFFVVVRNIFGDADSVKVVKL